MQRKIQVVLAGPYPLEGRMQGTYGRILDNIRNSPVFSDTITFTPLRMAIPSEGSLARRWLANARRMLSMLREAHEVDVFHLVMQFKRGLYTEYPLLLAATLSGIPTIVDFRTGALQRAQREIHNAVQRWMVEDLFRIASCVVVECSGDVDFVAEQCGRRPLLIPNITLQTTVDRVQPARLPPAAGEPLRLIYSGRYVRDKGICEVLDALTILSERKRRVEFHLTGSGEDEDVNRQIEWFCLHPPPGTRVVDHGHDIPDLLGLLASAHVFVMPTFWPDEGHPSSLSEAMTAGLSLVLSEWIHLSGLIPPGGAIVVKPRCPAEVAGAIERLIESPEQLTRSGELNRRYVEAHHTDQVVYPRLRAAYSEVARRA